jgi:hypothetical protein
MSKGPVLPPSPPLPVARHVVPPAGTRSLLRQMTILALWLCVLPALAAADASTPGPVLEANAAETASGEVYYVRVDGGDARRCNGRFDAPAPATGRAQDCAWRHPFVALAPGGKSRIKGGDWLFIRPGDYRMGIGAPDAKCSSDYPWDCYMAAIPSGPSATQPTRISGVDAAGMCVERPELWGAERAGRVINLQGSSNILLECLRITDREGCAEGHCHGGSCKEVKRCQRETYPYGNWSATGIYASDSANVRIYDVEVHGMAQRGFHAGRLRDWSLTRVRIIGNGWSGWDGDLGSEGSSNDGTLHFREVEIAWNGCVESWPDRTLGGCWAQTAGGYGDGLGTATTGGHWIFEDVDVHHNTSDGLDLLYIASPGRVTARRLRAHANAGNQLKVSGAASITDSDIDGTCTAFNAVGNMADGDNCRALGVAVSVTLHPQTHVELVNNRIRGSGDCLVVVGGGDATSTVAMQGNRLSGRSLWNNRSRRACGFYAHETEARVEFIRNTFLGVRNRQCPAGSECGPAEDRS